MSAIGLISMKSFLSLDSFFNLLSTHLAQWLLGVRSNDPQKNESVKNVPDTLMECFCAFRLMAIRLHLYPRITGRGNEASTDRWIFCRMAIDYTRSAFPTQLFYLIVERIAWKRKGRQKDGELSEWKQICHVLVQAE